MAWRWSSADHGAVQGRIGRFGRAALAGVLTVLVAALLPGCSTDPESFDTTLVRAVDVTVEHRDGSRTPGRDGLELQRGDVVRTGGDGSAELATGGRLLLLADSTALQVTSGTAEKLLRGAALVDARRGPRLRLSVGAVTVGAPVGGVVRVDRRSAVRVGVFEGRVRVSTAAGRALAVEPLHQVQAAGRTLPDRPSPLTLVGDAWERRVAPELVATDVLLRALATGLDTDPVLRPAAVAINAPATEPPSERVLPTAIAEASDTDRPAAVVRGDRSAGGSWGVVAALAVASGRDVGAAIDALLATIDESGGALPPGGGAGGEPDGTPGEPAAPDVDGDDTPADPSPPRTTNRPRPRPTPTPSSSPTEEPDLIEQAVATVESALPIPLPTVSLPPLAPLLPLPDPLLPLR